MNELMTLNEVAGYLKVTKKTAYRWLIRWKIPIIRIGRFVRINSNDVKEFLRNNQHNY